MMNAPALAELVISDDDDDARAPLPDTPILEEGHAERSETLPDGLVADGDHYALDLHHPITLKFKSAEGAVREENFARLPIRRLTGKDMREMMMSDRRDASMLLLERCVMMAPARVGQILDRLDAADITRAMGVVAFLAVGSPKTGR